MDIATLTAVLLAIAGGVGSGVGEGLWTALRSLVQRAARTSHELQESAAHVANAETQFAALEMQPQDQRRAQALASTLLTSAADDPEFRNVLEVWWEQALPVRREGMVTNSISGDSRIMGNVIQARDVGTINL